jgi:hypothetical protein
MEQDPFTVVERRLTAAPTKAAPQTSDELPLLWAFFDAWEALHAIQGDKRNMAVKKKYEDAAQALVEAAQPLRVKRHGN